MPSSFTTAVRMNGGSIVAPVTGIRKASPVGDLSVRQATNTRSAAVHNTSTVPDPRSFAMQRNVPLPVHHQHVGCPPGILQRWPVPSSIPQYIDASHRRLRDEWRMNQKFQQLVQQAIGEGTCHQSAMLIYRTHLNNEWYTWCKHKWLLLFCR